MRYRFSYNVPSRIMLTLLGGGPSLSWVDVRPDAIRGRLGWLGEVMIPRASVISVERVDHVPWWLGMGLHGFMGTWAFNGAMGNAVKITARGGARGRVLFLPIRPHTVYLSLEQPEEFVHELTREA
jgi:hypothetical protein